MLGKVRCIRRPLSSPVSTCRIQLLVTPSAHPALDATLDNFRSVTFVPVAPGDVAGKKTVRRNSPLGFRARARTKPCALKRWSALGFAPLRSPSRHASVLLSSPGCTGRGEASRHCCSLPGGSSFRVGGSSPLAVRFPARTAARCPHGRL